MWYHLPSAITTAQRRHVADHRSDHSNEVEERRQRGLGNSVKLTTSRSYKDIVLANILGPVNVVLYVIGLGMILVGDYRSALFTVGLVVFNAGIGVAQEVRAKQRARSHRPARRAPR